MDLQVIDGNITQQPVDAIITTAGIDGQFHGSIGEAICRAAGNQYHNQLIQQLNRHGNKDFPGAIDGSAFSLHKQTAHVGKFQSVICVIDAVNRPIDQVILLGLNLAALNAYQHVALPAIWFATENTAGSTLQKNITSIANALKLQSASDELASVRLVVDSNPLLSMQFRQALAIA